MTLITTVIDDKSPLISYDASWLPGSSQDDNYAIDYYLGTFQKNNAADGTATFTFNGTAVWVYGANRPNHGLYTVQLDSTTYPAVNGSGNNLFQQTLFNANVNQGKHTLTLVNTDGGSGLYVDIDMIVWQSQVGSTGDQLAPELVSDGDTRFQYQQAAWGTTSPSSDLNLNLFNNGTGHVTNTYSSTVSFTFTVRLPPPCYCLQLTRVYYRACLSSRTSPFRLTTLAGEAVTLFGTSGPSNGPYSIQLDGGQSVTYNATNVYPTNYGVVVYHADNLGPGTHQIVLTNLPATNKQYLSIDYAQVWAAANASSSSVSCTPSIASGNNVVTQDKLSSGAIAGLVVEGVIAVLAAAVAALFYWRWKAALAARTPYTPLYQPPEMTATGPAPSSLETRTSLDASFQPLGTAGLSHPQLRPNSTTQGASFPEQALHQEQTVERRPLPSTPDGGVPRPKELPPPGYETAVGTNA